MRCAMRCARGASRSGAQTRPPRRHRRPYDNPHPHNSPLSGEDLLPLPGSWSTALARDTLQTTTADCSGHAMTLLIQRRSGSPASNEAHLAYQYRHGLLWGSPFTALTANHYTNAASKLRAMATSQRCSVPTLARGGERQRTVTHKGRQSQDVRQPLSNMGFANVVCGVPWI